MAPRLIKPLQIGLSSRVLEQDNRFHLILTAALGVPLDGKQPLLEPEYLEKVVQGLGEHPPDPGMPKPTGEFLLSGSFHAPGGRPVRGHEVKVALGALSKRLYVFGPRTWGALGPSAPLPMTRAPLTWALAFGGPGFQANPQGLGFRDGALPRIEAPAQLVASPGDRPEPAGFGPLGLADPRRTRFQPRYDASYLRRFYPGYPAGLDWRFFLCAPEDQRLPGFFQGDEPFALHHLHPQRPAIRGRLPGLRVRCFLRQEQAFRELPMNLDTVWFFPDQMLALLLWRGGIQVDDDEAARVSHVLAACEDRAQRGMDHYRQALARRLESTDPLLDQLTTGDLLPDGMPCAMAILAGRAQAGRRPDPVARNLEAKAAQVKAMAEAKLEEALRAGEAQLAAAGLATDALARPGQAPPDPELDAFRAKLEALLPGLLGGDPAQLQWKDFSFRKLDQAMAAMGEFCAGKQARVQAELEQVKARVREQVRQQGQGPAELEAGLALTLQALDPPPATPPLPRVDAAALLAVLAAPQVGAGMQHLLAMQGTGADAAQVAAMAATLERTLAAQRALAEESLGKAERAFREGYGRSAHFLAEGGSPHHEPLEAVRARLLQSYARGASLAEGDWACLDLARRPLDGADLRGALLEQVDLRGASLRGADLRGAILARARLEDADLSGANLEGANLGAVRADRALFRQANLNRAQLSRGRFSGAQFQGCTLEGAETLDLVLDGADFTEAVMPRMTLLKPALEGTRFPRARLAGSVFLQGSLTGVDCTGADLSRTVWADLRFRQVCFDQANLEGACFVASAPDQAGMAEVRFRGAKLDRGNFQNLSMAGTDLSGASLVQANFAGADLGRALLRGADARQAQFRKACLAGADLSRSNLMEGSLAKANLVDARFQGANLYAVDFLRCTLGRTDFDGCNLERTLIARWRPQ
jgi:uncharacterized protein YjbI with pentapeptide repeats